MRAKALAGGLTCLFVCALAVGCGDDEGGSKDGGAGDSAGAGGVSGTGGGGSGGRDTLPEPDGGPDDNDAAVMLGEAPEGGGCRTMADCAAAPDGLQYACIEANNGFGICARACAGDPDCEADEVCDSPYTGLARDAHCINLVDVEFAECGGQFTALCSLEAGLSCFLYPDAPLGVCMTPCVAEEEDDAGVSDSMCKTDQSCVTSVIDDDETTPEGVCGALAARGESCGSDTGVFCGDEDICAPDDPTAAVPVLTCHQRCTQASDSCEEGTCQAVRTIFYCR